MSYKIGPEGREVKQWWDKSSKGSKHQDWWEWVTLNVKQKPLCHFHGNTERSVMWHWQCERQWCCLKCVLSRKDSMRIIFFGVQHISFCVHTDAGLELHCKSYPHNHSKRRGTHLSVMEAIWNWLIRQFPKGSNMEFLLYLYGAGKKDNSEKFQKCE